MMRAAVAASSATWASTPPAAMSAESRANAEARSVISARAKATSCRMSVEVS